MSHHDPLCRHSTATGILRANLTGHNGEEIGCECSLIHQARLDQMELCLEVVDKGGRAETQLRALLELLTPTSPGDAA